MMLSWSDCPYQSIPIISFDGHIAVITSLELQHKIEEEQTRKDQYIINSYLNNSGLGGAAIIKGHDGCY